MAPASSGLADRLMPSLGDLVLIGGAASAIWAWWRQRRSRKARERARFELRDEALILVLRTQTQLLKILANRPCFVGVVCPQPDDADSDEVRLQSAIAILLHDLEAVSTRYGDAVTKRG